MMLKKDFPILEFDPAPRAKIEPSDVIKKARFSRALRNHILW